MRPLPRCLSHPLARARWESLYAALGLRMPKQLTRWLKVS